MAKGGKLQDISSVFEKVLDKPRNHLIDFFHSSQLELLLQGKIISNTTVIFCFALPCLLKFIEARIYPPIGI